MDECQLILIAGDNVSEAGFVANSIEVVGAGWKRTRTQRSQILPAIRNKTSDKSNLERTACLALCLKSPAKTQGFVGPSICYEGKKNQGGIAFVTSQRGLTFQNCG